VPGVVGDRISLADAVGIAPPGCRLEVVGGAARGFHATSRSGSGEDPEEGGGAGQPSSTFLPGG
jgi:hypothetical protein